MAITPELISELKAKYPDAKSFHKLSTKMGDGTIVEGIVRMPVPSAAYAMSREKALEPSAQEKATASRVLFNAAVVHPEGTERDQLVKDWPGLPETWGGEIAELAGLIRGTVVEKL